MGEDATLEPTNPYSAAKAGAEMIAKAYLTSYRLPVITTRGNNVYGPHQFPEKSVPKFVLLALRAERLPIHGSGARSLPATPETLARTRSRRPAHGARRVPSRRAAWVVLCHRCKGRGGGEDREQTQGTVIKKP